MPGGAAGLAQQLEDVARALGARPPGGGRSISGLRKLAAFSNSALNGASASASLRETRATCS